MSEPRTIDNLGITPSQRYAEDQSTYDSRYIKTSRQVSQQVSTINITAHEDHLSSLIRQKSSGQCLAKFSAPEGYEEQAMRLFTSQSLPELGSIEQYRQLIASLEERLSHDDPEEKKQKQNQDSEEKEEEDPEEMKMLLQFLQLIYAIEEMFQAIYGFKNQYSRG
ncbi:MAG: DUF5399 family protein [Chlamydiota bacterium]|nr:DUF5399 family protein [Chlamydiota bacterium]